MDAGRPFVLWVRQHTVGRCINWLTPASLNKQRQRKYYKYRWFSIPYNTSVWGRIVLCPLQTEVQARKLFSSQVSLACFFTAWPTWLLSASCGPPTQTRTLASSDEVCCISGKARQNVREYWRDEKEIRYLLRSTDSTEGLKCFVTCWPS
jgi:hypothetical protein